ncbi:low specificity L-threonine aldolase [Rhodobacteraceae bacterium 2CG4]|uniref:L-threonine aldolase n=1 Tax=Halovulum marinum TaxID=2662447 RepID=A0A6L5Z050_9RHOB|nr:low specificity L-threonine aldolase [Halovulum marinum]MSU89659.1 low specificity L-threonine aldolase [Halovulum marinum]
MHFESDNSGPAHPSVLEALAQANRGYAGSYGGDDLTGRVRDRIREIFEAPEAAVYLVATGTAANALGLATICEPYQTVLCHPIAHIEEDECGAPEFFTGGAKLTHVPGENGKIAGRALAQAIAGCRQGFVHAVQRGPLSISQATETGTVYALGELYALTGQARDAGMKVHMDGARFANALASLGCTPAEMSWKAGVDVLSFGGTKNGLLAAEAVVIFDPGLAWEFELRRKRAGHLFSKYRVLSAQFDAYLAGDLWLKLAADANTCAGALAEGLAQVDGTRLVYPPDANMVFFEAHADRHRALRAAGARYHLWPAGAALEGAGDAPVAARLVCGWSTGAAEVDGFLTALRAA